MAYSFDLIELYTRVTHTTVGGLVQQATVAYARQTERPCGSCHVNRAGGGRLTEDCAAFAKKHR